MKFFKKLLLTLMLVVVVVVCAIVYTGYTMYNSAIDKTNITTKISEIKSKENYTNINDISDDFKNAIICVEDHRFNEHNGIDLITTARCMFENIRQQDIVARW